MQKIYEDSNFYIEVEPSEIPWLKLFTHQPYKEISQMPRDLRREMWEIVNTMEEMMLKYYSPTKINIASFANMLPRVHIHVMARFETDSYYPNPMWGEKLRDSTVKLPDAEIFYEKLQQTLRNPQ